MPLIEVVRGLFGEFDGPDRPGASALLIRNRQTLVAAGWGMADLAAGVSATSATRYRLASVSKQFTAFAVMLLVERGRLQLDDPIARYFDHAPPVWQTISIRMLLSHTSGLSDYEDLIPAIRTTQLSDRDVRDMLIDRNETYFPPGTAYRYSNTGYCLLALIVEQLSAMPFEMALHHQIFQPLGMTGAVAHREGSTHVAHRAYGHSRAAGGFVRTDQSLTSATLGDGGIYASVDDLARWDAELSAPTLLRPATLAQLFAPAVAIPPGTISYGFGWYLCRDGNRAVAYHTGETIGFRTAIVRLLERHLTAVVLTNRSEAVPLDIAWALIRAADQQE